jgi:hypothetical protein
MDQNLANKNVSAINCTYYAWHATPGFEIKHHHSHIFTHRLDDWFLKTLIVANIS